MDASVQHDIILLDPTISWLVNKSIVIWQAENDRLIFWSVAKFSMDPSFQHYIKGQSNNISHISSDTLIRYSELIILYLHFFFDIISSILYKYLQKSENYK